jgi:hypothetical protein
MTKRKLVKADLVEIAARLRKFSKEVIRVKIRANRDEIIFICKDEPTNKNINIIHSATIDIDGVRFELVVDDKK